MPFILDNIIDDEYNRPTQRETTTVPTLEGGIQSHYETSRNGSENTRGGSPSP